MWALTLDHVWSAFGASRGRSMRRRLRAADRRIASLIDDARTSPHGSFELEPWRYPLPSTVLVDLAAARGFVPESFGAEWELRERVRFVPGALGEGSAAHADVAVSGAATSGVIPGRGEG